MKIEAKLKMSVTKSEIGRPLQWEIWLRSFGNEKNSKNFLTTSGHMKWIYNLRAGLLLFSFYVTILYGFWLVLTFASIISPLSVIILIILMLMFSIIYLILFLKIGLQLGVEQEPIILSELFPNNSIIVKNEKETVLFNK